MKYAEAVDIGTAPELYLSGVAQVEQLGPGTVRVTFHSSRGEDNVVALYAVMDLDAFYENVARLEEAVQYLRYGRPRVLRDQAKAEAH